MRHSLTAATTFLFAPMCMAFLGWANLHTDETGFLAGCVALSAFLLSALHPRGAVRFAVLCGASVPLGAIVARVLEVPVRFPSGWGAIVESCLAFVPAAIGAFAGVVSRSASDAPGGAAGR